MQWSYRFTIAFFSNDCVCAFVCVYLVCVFMFSGVDIANYREMY